MYISSFLKIKVW